MSLNFFDWGPKLWLSRQQPAQKIFAGIADLLRPLRFLKNWQEKAQVYLISTRIFVQVEAFSC